MNKYKSEAMSTNGYAYVEICKGMYGLKQAGKLANDQLITHLGWPMVPRNKINPVHTRSG
jgi:hypothetical protein